MIADDNIQNVLNRLADWLETWRNEHGGYHGFVIHRLEKKRMKDIRQTAWTQAAMIRAYSNLFRACGDEYWKVKAMEAADAQANDFIADNGKFRFAGHEDERFTSLVHCALADCALLDTFDFIDDARKEKYLDIVQANIDKYWLKSLWVEECGAFRFSEIDFYSNGKHRFVINFNCMALETLLKFNRLRTVEPFGKVAARVGKWLLDRLEESYKFFCDNMPADGGFHPGAMPYQFGKSRATPDNCVFLYSGLSLRGLCELYQETGDIRCKKIIENGVEGLLASRDPQTRLFYHTTHGFHIDPYPQFIAGTGMILVGIARAEEVTGRKWDYEDTVESILGQQQANGSFPCFIGKNRSHSRRFKSGIETWEDHVAGVNWNAQLFEYLSLRRGVLNHRQAERQSAHCVLKKNFFYSDTRDKVTIISLWPIESAGIFHAQKKNTRATLCLFRETVSQIIEKICCKRPRV